MLFSATCRQPGEQTVLCNCQVQTAFRPSPFPALKGEVSGDAADPAACPLGMAPATVTSVGGVEQQVIVPGFWCERRSSSQCWEAVTEGGCGRAGTAGVRTAGSRGGWLHAAALARCAPGSPPAAVRHCHSLAPRVVCHSLLPFIS